MQYVTFGPLHPFRFRVDYRLLALVLALFFILLVGIFRSFKNEAKLGADGLRQVPRWRFWEGP